MDVVLASPKIEGEGTKEGDDDSSESEAGQQDSGSEGNGQWQTGENDVRKRKKAGANERKKQPATSEIVDTAMDKNQRQVDDRRFIDQRRNTSYELSAKSKVFGLTFSWKKRHSIDFRRDEVRCPINESPSRFEDEENELPNERQSLSISRSGRFKQKARRRSALFDNPDLCNIGPPSSAVDAPELEEDDEEVTQL